MAWSAFRSGFQKGIGQSISSAINSSVMYCSPMDVDSEEVSDDWVAFITFLFLACFDVDTDEEEEEWRVLNLS